MNTLRRKMFANGNVVNIDPFILPRNPDVAGDSLLPHLIAQGSGLNQKDPSDYRMGGGLASQLTDQNFPPFQKMPEEGLIPDADVDALFEKINDVLLPNEIELSNGERIDFTEEIKAIQSGEAGEGYNIYPILRSPNIKLGTNVKAVLKDFGERDTPGFLKMLGQEDTDFGDMARLGIATIGEIGKENLKQIVPFFTGQRAFDKYTKDIPFVKSEFMGGDPKGFKETSGRSAEEVDALVRNFNTNNFGDTITDALNNLDVDTSKFSGFFSKDPSEMILETDTVRRKRFEDAQEGTIQENLNNVSEEAGTGGAPDKSVDVLEKELKEVVVNEVPSQDKKQPIEDDEPPTKTAEEITSEEAPKRNFAQFTRSPDFLRFVRNIGKGLTTTGQLGQGIALGAAGAAEEKYAEEVALRAAQSKSSDFAEFIAKERIKNTSGSKIAEQTTKLAEAINDIEQGEASVDLFSSVKQIMGNAEITGVGAIAGALWAQAKGFMPGGSQEPITPRERAIVILEQIANGNIKTITGESGRTISNVDREIAEKLVGSLKNPLTRETEVLERIEAQIRSINQRTNTARNKYDAISLYFTENGLKVPLQPRSFGVPTASNNQSNPYEGTDITFIDDTK